MARRRVLNAWKGGSTCWRSCSAALWGEPNLIPLSFTGILEEQMKTSNPMCIPILRRTEPQCWSILWNVLYTRNCSQFIIIVEFPNNRREDFRSLPQLSYTIASSMTNFQNPRRRSLKLRSVGFKIAWNPMCIPISIHTKPQWRSILWNVH